MPKDPDIVPYDTGLLDGALIREAGKLAGIPGVLERLSHNFSKGIIKSDIRHIPPTI